MYSVQYNSKQLLQEGNGKRQGKPQCNRTGKFTGPVLQRAFSVTLPVTANLNALSTCILYDVSDQLARNSVIFEFENRVLKSSQSVSQSVSQVLLVPE